MAIIVGLLAFVVYLRTLAPDVPAGDSGELITVAWLPGVAHPPGYPLYTLLGHAWCAVVQFGSVAWRMNLLSAVLAAVTVILVARLVLRLTGSAVSAMVAGALLAFSAPFWKYAVVAEVFALNALLGVVLLTAFVEVVEGTGWTSIGIGTAGTGGAEDGSAARAAGAAGRARPNLVSRSQVRSVATIALVSVLTLSHHHTLVLLALPICLATLILLLRGRGSGRSPVFAARPMGVAAVAAIAGLVPLVYLPLAAMRNPALNWGDPRTGGRFLDVLLRREYGTFRLDPESGGYVADRSHVLLYLGSLPRDFTWLGLVLIAAGVWILFRRRHPLGAVVAGFGLLQLAFFTRVNFPSEPLVYRGVVERFHILPAMVLALVAGVGCAWLLKQVPGRGRGSLGVILAAGAILLPFTAHFTLADQRGNRFTGDLAHNVLESVPPQGVLFTQGDIFHNGVAYLRLVEGARTDVDALDEELLTRAWYVANTRRRAPGLLPARLGPEDRYDGSAASGTLAWCDHLAGTRPVAILGVTDRTFEARYELVSRGMLLVVHPRGEAPSLREQAAVALDLAARFRLDAYFREYDPWSIEATELWRFPEFVGRTAILLARPECFDLTPESSPGFAALVRFLDRDRSRGDAADLELLAASGFLHATHPAVRDLARARADLTRYLRIRPDGPRATDAGRVLEQLGGAR